MCLGSLVCGFNTCKHYSFNGLVISSTGSGFWKVDHAVKYCILGARTA